MRHTTIIEYLRRNIADVEWSFELPERGNSVGKSFVAVAPSQKVLVRMGIEPGIVRTLADAGITPPFLGGGDVDGTHFYVQTWVDATHPDERWYREHAGTLAALISKLQQQRELRSYLPAYTDESYRACLGRYLAETEREWDKVPADHRHTRVMQELIAEYHHRIPRVHGGGLVPCHGDPNSGNILITKEQVHLTDWETLHLSDPIRDAAHVLWWMYRRNDWERMLAHFAIDLAEESVRERFYLHVSLRALYVYLLFVNIGQEQLATRFLDDARRSAAYQQPSRLLIA